LIEERFGRKISDLSKDELSQIISEWKENKVKLNYKILKDAEKEFDQSSKIGFGIDGDSKVQEEDFENVRGKFEDNKFVQSLKKDSELITQKAELFISKLL
jgi:hypothetical protein